jgi:3-deoxy-manno-octulosonate cytidylyltransferase (CMP-KDO synthetase)
MIIGLIPSRLKSSRLVQKPLLEIDGIPLIIHTLKRAQLCKTLNKVIVCTDSQKILSLVKSYGGEAMITKNSHKNGTERIAEVARKFSAKLIVDIQGDEPLIQPKHIDKVVRFHLKNPSFDLVIPSSNLTDPKSKNIVKIVATKKNKILYLSRASIPFEFKSKAIFKKHLSIITFKPMALQKYSKLPKSNLEKIEDIELLRAIENEMNVGTVFVDSKSISVDIKEDYLTATELMKKDKIRKKY